MVQQKKNLRPVPEQKIVDCAFSVYLLDFRRQMFRHNDERRQDQSDSHHTQTSAEKNDMGPKDFVNITPQNQSHRSTNDLIGGDKNGVTSSGQLEWSSRRVNRDGTDPKERKTTTVTRLTDENNPQL
jgi:hypothetical protein